MSELITTGQAVTMSSREIAELTGKQHTNVMRDIRKMLADLGVTELKFESSYVDSTGRTLPMFNLPKRETLILISGYDTVLRARVVDRVTELEAASKTALPRTFAEALRLAAALEEENQRQKEALALAAPKIELANAVIADESLMALSEAAAELGVPRNKFFAVLDKAKWIYKRVQFDSVKTGAWLPMSDKMAKGLLVLKKRPDERGVLRDQTLVTGKGLAALQGLFA